MEEKECSMEQVIENLQKQVEDLNNAKAALLKNLEDMTNSKNRWYDLWSKEYDINNAYKGRLEKLQHACRLMGDIIGELDIKAVKGKEEA